MSDKEEDQTKIIEEDSIPFLRESEKMEATFPFPKFKATPFRKDADLLITRLLQEELQYSIENKSHCVAAIGGSGKSAADKFEIAIELAGMKLMYDLICNLFKRELDQLGFSISFLNTEHNENILVISKSYSPIDGSYYTTRKPKGDQL